MTKNRLKKRVFVLLLLFSTVICQVMTSTNLTGKQDRSLKKKYINKITAKERRQGWELLFDGKSFTGWRGYNRQEIPSVWAIEDGAIKVESSKRIKGDQSSAGDIIYDKKFKNFEFCFEWRISESGNSGVFFLAQEIEGKPIYISAPEYQLLDNENHPDGKLGRDGNRKSASLYDMIPAVPQNANPTMVWNSGGITLKDGKVTHYQNGVKVLEYTLWTEEWHNLIENSKFKGWQNMINVGGPDKQGYIGLQYHGDDIWFRNLKIRVLE